MRLSPVLDSQYRCTRTLARLLGIVAVVLGTAPGVVAQYNGPPTNADHSNVTSVTDEQGLLHPSTPDTVLEPGDQITVRLFSDPDYNVSTRIGADGTALMPLIGKVQLLGVTVSNSEQMIARELEDAGMYRAPQVILQISEGPSSVITLAGEMHNLLPVVGSRNLYAVIAAGGGLPNSASRTVVIFRAGSTQPISVDLGNDPLHSAAANIPIFPGDTVVVSRIGVVYVMGEFKNPGIVNMTNYGPLTLTQVAAMVGGPIYDARYNELHIIRTEGDRRTVTTLNIRNVLYGKAPDPIMQPNDIVFLPPSGIKASVNNGALASSIDIIYFALAAVATFR